MVGPIPWRVNALDADSEWGEKILIQPNSHTDRRVRGIREESEEEVDVARTGEVVTVGGMSNTPRLPRSRASAWKKAKERREERGE